MNHEQCVRELVIDDSDYQSKVSKGYRSLKCHEVVLKA